MVIRTTEKSYNSTHQRRRVMLAMMLLTTLGGIVFFSINLNRGLIALALSQLAFVAYSILLLPVVMRTRALRFWALVYLSPWLVLMLVVLWAPQSSFAAFIWPMLVPLVLHFVLGRKLGLLLSLAGLIGTLIVAWLRFGLPTTSEELVIPANFLMAGLAMVVLAFVYERGRELAEADLRRLAVTDHLTGLANRSLIGESFSRLRAISDRQATPLSLLMIDLDHFKRINDQHGHDAGDRTLVAFADFMRQRLRDSDFICRTGGEEFLVLLPGSDSNQATGVAEHLRWQLEQNPIAYIDDHTPLTVSIGVAEYRQDGNELNQLVSVADKRLYKGKSNGRNQVESGFWKAIE